MSGQVPLQMWKRCPFSMQSSLHKIILLEFLKRCTIFGPLEIEKKVKEERSAREKAENRIVQIEKQCSMLDFDLKQSQQKLEHLSEQKERLEDEVIKSA